jgi:hypothetical protein
MVVMIMKPLRGGDTFLDAVNLLQELDVIAESANVLVAPVVHVMQIELRAVDGREEQESRLGVVVTTGWTGYGQTPTSPGKTNLEREGGVPPLLQKLDTSTRETFI